MMNTTKTETIDPICGMTVDEATALHAERDGKTFYFCGEHCHEKFLSTPAGAKEDEPAYIFRRLRRLPPNTPIREGLSCEWCMSIWAGALVATCYWWVEIIPGIEWRLYWLAKSTLGIICNQRRTKVSKETEQSNAVGAPYKRQRPEQIEQMSDQAKKQKG